MITTFDFKNYFDCIPLHKDDWAFAIVSTPLGIRKMTHLSYGYKNAAPHAQRIMNELCMNIPYCMGYIDDGTMKHPLTWGTEKLIGHLRKLFLQVRLRNILLHPEKFNPFSTEVVSLGISRSLFGSEISKKYVKKVLGLPKPSIIADLRTAIGVITYIARYI